MSPSFIVQASLRFMSDPMMIYTEFKETSTLLENDSLIILSSLKKYSAQNEKQFRMILETRKLLVIDLMTIESAMIQAEWSLETEIYTAKNNAESVQFPHGTQSNIQSDADDESISHKCEVSASWRQG